MELTELQKQIEAIAEELNKLKCNSENCDSALTEADDSEEETKEEETQTIVEVDPEDNETETVETETEVEETAEEDDAYIGELLRQIGGSLLQTFMDSLNEINVLAGDAGMNKYADIIADIKDNTNKAIGSLQAILSNGNSDVAAQDEARREAEDKLDDSPEDESDNGEDEEESTDAETDELEVIKPVAFDDEEEVNEDDVEEVEYEEEDEKEKTKESFHESVSSKNKSYSLTEAFGKNVDAEIHSDKGFYVGDICYALDRDVYDNVWGGAGYEDGEYEVEDGLKFAVGGTAYGDGEYADDNGHTYSVDAGVIGIVPLELAVKYDLDELDRLGRVVKTPGDAYFEAENGQFEVTLPGRNVINIDTNYEYWDDEEEEEDWDYEADEDEVEDIDDEVDYDESYNPDDNPDDIVEARSRFHKR